MRPSTDKPAIVISFLAGVGNSLLGVPMVRQIKAHWPDAHITILARWPAFGEPLRRLPEVAEVLHTGVGVKAFFRHLIWCRQRRADFYLVPFPSARWHYSILALFSGARKNVLHGYPKNYWRTFGFVGVRVPAIPGLHDVEQNLRLLSGLGIALPPTEPPVFPLNDEDRRRAEELLRSAGIEPESKFVAIHPGSGATALSRAKRWPPAKYAELIDRITTELETSVVLLEGPDESGVADEIIKCSPHRTRMSAAGLAALKLTGPLGDAAAVLERAALYVGSDSGLAHLAGAVATRAVTLFAPADPDRVCPFGQRDLVVQASTPCSPCHMYPWQTPYPKIRCREPYCVDTIEVERVFERVRAAMGASLVPSPSGRGLG